MRMATAIRILSLLALLALAGCGGDSKPASSPATQPATSDTTGTTTRTTPSDTETETSGDIDPLEGAGTDPVVVKATNSDTALLTAVRAARHEGYDRVVFEFANTLPGYDVRYVQRPVLEDASGRNVAVEGAAVLRVRMENALDADLSKESAPSTYTGPRRFNPGTPEIAELVRSGGFEGVLTWVAGVRDRVDFKVSTLQSPPRVVVDLRNH
jgi:hypothetical protein